MGASSNAGNRVQKSLLLGEVMDMLPAEDAESTPTPSVPTSGVPHSVSLSLADDTQLAAHPASLANQSAYAPMPRPAASIPRSTAALQQWLQRERMIFPELVLENGAGLSRKERISASHLAELLRHAATAVTRQNWNLRCRYWGWTEP